MTDSVTSNGLTKFIKGLGGKHFRYKRGYKNVISKGIELNEKGEETNLMMETRFEIPPSGQLSVKALEVCCLLAMPRGHVRVMFLPK